MSEDLLSTKCLGCMFFRDTGNYGQPLVPSCTDKRGSQFSVFFPVNSDFFN